MPKLLLYSLAVFRLSAFILITSLAIIFYLIFRFQSRLTGIEVVHKFIRKLWSRTALFFCGIRLKIVGEDVSKTSAIVLNHVSWLDILVIQSVCDIIFVSKLEVKTWFAFGFLARLVDTHFIERKTLSVKDHQKELLVRLQKSERLCLFPEGTSSDGLRVLPFKSSLFEIFIQYNKLSGLETFIQPVSIFYSAPKGKPKDFYGWWGEMSLINHLISVVGSWKKGDIILTFNSPISATKINDRKKLAKEAEKIIRASLRR